MLSGVNLRPRIPCTLNCSARQSVIPVLPYEKRGRFNPIQEMQMALHSAKSRTFSVNSLFPCFFLTLLGWGLVQTWGIVVKAGPLVNTLIGMPALALCGLVIYRYKHHWPRVAIGSKINNCGMVPLGCDAAAIAGVSLAIGVGLAAVVAIGSALIVTLSVFGLFYVPWSRLIICRNYFFTMALLIAASAMLGIVLTEELMFSLYYIGTALLILSVTSCVLLWIVIINGNRLDRMPVGGYPEDPIPGKLPLSDHEREMRGNVL